jgi:hypothetical protein
MTSHIFDRQKWADKSIFEQMGNIGSEVGRALHAKANGDQASMDGALYRGLDLFDATAETWAARKSPRTAEILRARELFVQAIVTENSDDSLEGYFTHFAIAARIQKGLA